LLSGVLVLSTLSVVLYADACTSMGRLPQGARAARAEASPQWHGDSFENPQPIVNDNTGALLSFFSGSAVAAPQQPIPVAGDHGSTFASPPTSGLRVTWFGHSSLLIEIDGVRILADPAFLDRASPFSWVGPSRWFAPPTPMSSLPPIDVVVVSHDHYDHLQQQTIEALIKTATRFVVPLGVGEHLASWGVPEDRITELDWWQETRIDGVTIVATPARHASGRHLVQARTLWAGYAFIGNEHRAYYSGDTGLFPAMSDIGAKLGPFDITMIEVGQYHATWPDWHIGPEQAVRAHKMVRGQLLLPVHWGLFELANHGWTEPAERVVVAAERAGVTIAMPRPGQPVEPSTPPSLERWWPSLPWSTAEQDPIASSQVPPH
jgi:L-ascorbate metabolism protein UlaG (beta-lactamase superfamily)